jgi:hypothetical protein
VLPVFEYREILMKVSIVRAIEIEGPDDWFFGQG